MKNGKLYLGLAVGALLGGLMLVGTTTTASAYIVCNPAGDCWHTDQRYHYPEAGYVFHPDDWYFHRTWDRDHWHDWHEGRGYWRNGVWVTF